MRSEAAKEAARIRTRAWSKANRARMRAYQTQWRKDNPEKQRANARKKKTGWDKASFDKAWAEQKGQCANPACGVALLPCGNKHNSVTGDHCHETGKLRALLCHRCNRWEGLLRMYGPIFDGLKGYQEAWRKRHEGL
jgi:hypothetical protein